MSDTKEHVLMRLKRGWRVSAIVNEIKPAFRSIALAKAFVLQVKRQRNEQN